MRNLYYYSSRFFSFSMKMRNWYQNISKYLFSMCTYWFPQLLPPPILSENEKYIQHLTDKFKHMLLKNDDGFKELLNNNIEKDFYDTNVKNKSIVNHWRTNIMLENTPYGSIVMFYNVDKQCFSYYSDTNSIPYSILNAASMKYVLTYHCLDFFMDTKYDYESSILLYLLDEEKRKEEAKKKEKTKKVGSSIDISKGPFLKKKKSIINMDEKKDEQTENNKKDENKLEYVNKFICEGKYRDYCFIQKAPKVFHTNGFRTKIMDDLDSEAQLQEQVLSYKDFKKLNK